MGILLTFLGSLFGGIITNFGKLFTLEALKFVAYKAMILFIVFIALPIVLYNVTVGLLFDFIEYALSYLTGLNISSQVVSIAGIGAYIATKIKLVEAVTVFLSFVSIKFIMRFIPFLR